MELVRLINQSVSFISSLVLRCAAELQISDHIKQYGGPMPLHELARSIPIPPEKDLMLVQLMELLVHQGVYAKCEAGYQLTPTSELLLTEGSNMGTFVSFIPEVFFGKRFFTGKWFKDTDVGTVSELAYNGKQIWHVFKEKPELGNFFNEAMASQCKESVRDLVASHPDIFYGINNLVDVGGGTGTTVKVIADTFPGLRCTVFDLPNVVENAPNSDSFSVVGGDMFDNIPTADAILLKTILHDWPDEDCVRILERCKEAVESTEKNGKVIVVDMVLDAEVNDSKETETKLLFNLLLISTVGGKERTKKEWHDLIIRAGYSDYKIYPARMSLYSVIELYP
ncbi:O-methyltransferase family protein [Rhynchospora pubera]|uniref:O-methyltransferase family protein n=1 Tax=Rhynchospora pubera TaxID=906938 RepID=A0AAV8BVB0_9POAL|nr:O-methyltransferase family protein [Rhynchospora pubera]KAJ4800573.1 O-methyltransferase family protein [Rhynchospora pubera]